MSIQSRILFAQIKNKFDKTAGFQVLKSNVFVDYRKNSFSISFENNKLNEEIKKQAKIEDFTEMSEMLLNAVKKKIKADEIQIINLNIFPYEKKTDAIIYYLKDGEKLSMELNEVF